MNRLDFPGCCTARIITGFGQTGTAEYEYRPQGVLTPYDIAQQVFEHMVTGRKRSHAGLVVTLNSQQKDALEVLRRLGWHVSDPMHKHAHSETQLHVCYTQTWDVADEERLENLKQAVASFA